MFERMHSAKATCDELKAFYNTRVAIEDEYARKLLALCRKPLGSGEIGTLRASFDVVRGETEAIAKAHSAIAAQMKSELEEPLVAFAGGLKERKKIVQSGIERVLKAKIQQTQAVNKARDRYEQDCLRIKGYLAQGHMVMGQEERKNKAKLEKTQIQLASNSSEYESAIKILEETTGRWNREWKAACDKFQDLEEERLDFTKSSLWTYANIASTVCVSDDASCEKIRLSLENCEVEKDIVAFIIEMGTGQEIPDAPKFINFCRGDMNDNTSEVSGEDGYSVAQFQRTINPAFRSSSPQPSTYESHHDPQSGLATRMGHGSPQNISNKETPANPQKEPQPQTQATQSMASSDTRRAAQLPPNYDPAQHGEIGTVPYNAYPIDGMTMFCRAGPPSERSSATSPYRPSSRDSQSECSNPTSISSQEPPNCKQPPPKPVNGVALPGMGTEKQVQKKRSAFFSNSPFRRKSRHEKDPRGAASSREQTGYQQSSPTKTAASPQSALDRGQGSTSPEPVDPRANFQLNVGSNVFDVASPDGDMAKKGLQATKKAEEDFDPIARALADLKGAGKQPSSRVSADRYHGLATPVPSASGSAYGTNSIATPPPAYHDAAVKRLDAPQPAFTSAQMQKTTRRYVDQTQNMFRSSDPTRPGTRSGEQGQFSQGIPRARSPTPRRSASPQVTPRTDLRMSQGSNGASPSPSSCQSNSARSPYSQSPGSGAPSPRNSDVAYSPHGYPKQNSPNSFTRAVSPRPQFQKQIRPSSAGGMELQLSGNQVEMYGASRDAYGSRPANGRPMSSYYVDGPGDGTQRSRPRSRTLAVSDSERQYSRDGRPILHFARALYSYTAAIPEELGFTKGDILAVIRLQDDGWWEAEVTSNRARPGLVPSNYLQVI